MNELLGIVLAAGRGRRVGGPKAWLRLGERTALEHCLATLERAGVSARRVVVAPGDEDRLPAGPGLEVVANPDPERGQTSSIRAALAAGVEGFDAFLLWPVDHPLVRAAAVRGLIDAYRRRGPSTRIVVPSHEGRRGHPALFEVALATEFLELGDDEPGHVVVRRDPRRVMHVVTTDGRTVSDIDTEADLARARREIEERPRD